MTDFQRGREDAQNGVGGSGEMYLAGWREGIMIAIAKLQQVNDNRDEYELEQHEREG